MSQTKKDVRNLKMELIYDGSRYSGWQRLGHTSEKEAIQTVLENCLTDVLKDKIKVIGSGRTDAGVHAKGQVANFFTISDMKLDEILYDINVKLPDDIKVTSIIEASKEFHSRYMAKSKTYEYRIDQNEIPCIFTRKYTYSIPNILNVKEMQKAASCLIGTHDFKAFCTDRKDGKSTVRTIESIDITSVLVEQYGRESLEVRIAITGNGFLYNMVRIIVGTLLEVGQGNRQPDTILSILNDKNRQNAGVTAPACGLSLLRVRY